MRHRQGTLRALNVAVLALLAMGAGAGAAPATPTASVATSALAGPERQGHVLATITDLRSNKGQILACLTRDPDTFPDCDKDPKAVHMTVPASQAHELDFGAVPQGRYAVALIHDENANGKLDKALMIPREGFGFSQNAPLRMGPPAFKDAAFTVDDGDASQSIRMRYIM